MTTTDATTWRDKIAKLLEKAESTTPQEAEALRERAFKLMAKYQIEQADVEARRGATSDDEIIVREKIVLTGVFRRGLMLLVHQVCEEFGTTTGYVNQRAIDSRTGKHAIEYWIVGYESDVERLSMLVHSLLIQGHRAEKKWWNTFELRDAIGRGEAHRTRRQFFVSFGQGAADRIRLARIAALNEASEGTEMVLVGRKQRVESWLENMVSLHSSKSRLQGGMKDAALDGYVAGHHADTGDPTIEE